MILRFRKKIRKRLFVDCCWGIVEEFLLIPLNLFTFCAFDKIVFHVYFYVYTYYEWVKFLLAVIYGSPRRHSNSSKTLQKMEEFLFIPLHLLCLWKDYLSCIFLCAHIYIHVGVIRKLIECIVNIFTCKIYSLQLLKMFRLILDPVSSIHRSIYLHYICAVIMSSHWCYIFQTVLNNQKDISYINEDFVNFNLLNTQVVWMR